MKLIRNRFIPFGRYAAINLFGVTFVKRGYTLDKTGINHEAIHTAQMRELLYIPFYILYVLEWIYRIFRYRNFFKAYRTLSFEREAYSNESDTTYLFHRPMFAQWRKSNKI